MNKTKKVAPSKKTVSVTTKSKPSLTPIKALRTGPKEVFLQLMNMAMLYIVVISLIILCFAYVDLKFPDILNTYSSQGAPDQIRIASSMLVVSFPLLLFFSKLNQKNLRKNPEKHQLRFGKWLTYLTLFVSSITLVIDLIVLIESFYSGELSLSFALKLLSILILAGIVLGYYIWEVQSKPYQSKIPSLMGWLSSVVVVGMLALGFVLVGSPMNQRQVRMDQERVNHLSNLQYQIINYWQLKNTLPASLEDLNNDLTGFRVPNDPETMKPYGYKVSDSLTFSLCAVFNQKNPGTNELTSYYDPYSGTPQNWSHGAGEVCFERTIDPELFPKPESASFFQ